MNCSRILFPTKRASDIDFKSARAETDSSFNSEIRLILAVANRTILRIARLQTNRPTCSSGWFPSMRQLSHLNQPVELPFLYFPLSG